MIAAIVNPKSANGRTEREWGSIKAALEVELGEVKGFMTEKNLHAIELTREALKQGAETVVSIGGDGTLNEVVNGFFENGEPINPAAKLAVILRGTGSDFVRSLDYPKEISEIARVIKNRPAKSCDLILARVNPLADAPAKRYFINIADLGIGGAMAIIMDRSSKVLGGKMSFFLGALRATLLYKNKLMKIELDGEVIGEDEAQYFVAVANGKYFGGGMFVAPDARMDDGLMDIVLTGNLTLFEKVKLSRMIYRGESEKIGKIRSFRGKHLKITTDEVVFIEADGELVGKADAEFVVLPKMINLIGI